VTSQSAGDSSDVPLIVGTEAVLHRVREVGTVVFLDFDQELLAPRYRAGEQALALLARASRLVGGRTGRGRILVQTRLPVNEVIDAAVHADPGRLAAEEAARRSALALPPATAIALVSGPSAEAYVEGLDAGAVDLLGPDDGRWLVRAPDHRALCDALAAVPRPPGRLRIEVDPLRA
jgi:primosomal protein N' (replication factor Y)